MGSYPIRPTTSTNMFGLEDELQAERNTALAVICDIIRDHPEFEERYITTEAEKKILAAYRKYVATWGRRI